MPKYQCFEGASWEGGYCRTCFATIRWNLFRWGLPVTAVLLKSLRLSGLSTSFPWKCLSQDILCKSLASMSEGSQPCEVFLSFFFAVFFFFKSHHSNSIGARQVRPCAYAFHFRYHLGSTGCIGPPYQQRRGLRGNHCPVEVPDMKG